jgi:hypothetical protein
MVNGIVADMLKVPEDVGEHDRRDVWLNNVGEEFSWVLKYSGKWRCNSWNV